MDFHISVLTEFFERNDSNAAQLSLINIYFQNDSGIVLDGLVNRDRSISF